MFRRICLLSPAFVLLFGANLCVAQTKHRRQTTIRLNTLLRLELLAMEEESQQEHIKSVLTLNEVDGSVFGVVDDVNQVDLRHTKRLREIIREFGWPSAALVGQRGVEAAFLIAQRSPSLKFQKQCLPLIRAAARSGDLSMQDFALFTDLVRTNEGKPQIYGTQFKHEGGKPVPYPIANPRGVNARRAAVGLPPLAEYAKKF